MKEPIHQDEKFNRNILIVVCIVGLARTIVEMGLRNTPESGVVDFYLDLGYGILFVYTLIALMLRFSYRLIHFAFFIPLIILLCLTLIDRRGLASSTENNIHVGIIVIVLTTRSTDAWKLSLLLIIGTIISLAVVEYQHHFLVSYTNYSTATFNYIFMGIGTVVVIYYAKKSLRRTKYNCRS